MLYFSKGCLLIGKKNILIILRKIPYVYNLILYLFKVIIQMHCLVDFIKI